MQLVESVEESLLRLLLRSDELDVIYQEGVGASVPLAELVSGARSNGLDVVVCKPFAAYVNDLQAFFHEFVADGVQQVGLSEAYLRVDVERVVDLAGGFGNPGGGGVGELVRIADDEGFESQSWPERVAVRPRLRLAYSCVRPGLRRWFTGDGELHVQGPLGHSLDDAGDNCGQPLFQRFGGEGAWRCYHKRVAVERLRGSVFEPGLEVWSWYLQLKLTEGSLPNFVC